MAGENPYLRFDIFLLIYFVSIGIFTQINDDVEVRRGKPLIGDQVEADVNASAILDAVSTNDSKTSIIEPTQQVPGLTDWLFGGLVYVWRLASWVTMNLWNATAGLPSHLQVEYGIPSAWAVPVGSIVGLINFLGVFQILTGKRF